MIFGTRCLPVFSYGIRGRTAAKAEVRNKIEPEMVVSFDEFEGTTSEVQGRRSTKKTLKRLFCFAILLRKSKQNEVKL